MSGSTTNLVLPFDFLAVDFEFQPFLLLREFKTEEILEGWLDTTEANNLVDQYLTKYRQN